MIWVAKNLYFFNCLLDGAHTNDLKSLMRQPLLHKEKHCATRVLLVTHFHRRPQRIDTCDGETAVTGGLIDRFQLADQ